MIALKIFVGYVLLIMLYVLLEMIYKKYKDDNKKRY